MTNFLSCFLVIIIIVFDVDKIRCDDIIGCGGFIKSEVEINFSLIEVKLYTKQGSLKYQTDCAPNNGYYLVPVYDKGEYVLKVEPPPGWTFEPQSLEILIDGKNDKCSRGEDINFQFTGFGVVGKIISKGQNSGPLGVTLTLKKADTQELIKTTNSVVGGGYTFEKVLPGRYVVEATHPTWLFEVSNIEVTVGRETGNAGSAIVVAGYDVQGQVFSDGEPVTGVHFILFSPETQKPGLLHGCDTTPLADAPLITGYHLLCHVTSSSGGLFRFASVPCGNYILVPFYKGDNIKFDVIPNKMDLVIEHDSFLLQNPFQVAGFTVSGFVRSSNGGLGIRNAKITINGQLQTVTGDDGSYHLDSMKAGSYEINVETERMSFDGSTVKITPNTPRLSDIVASRFQVCGMITIEKLPEGLRKGMRQLSIDIKKESGAVDQSVKAAVDGGFCVFLKPGRYLLSIDLNEMEIKAGLRLAPDKRVVHVVDQPIDDVTFSQFRATVEGKVHCLESCGQVLLSMSSTATNEENKMELSTTDKIVSFVFDDVMPGKYKVSVLNEQWCWKNKTIDIDVADKNLVDVDFVQYGYMLSCSLSHSAVLNFEHESQPGTYFKSFNLTKGINKFCLPLPGGYQMELVSCHRFEQDFYRYDTSVPSLLALTAVDHLVEGSVTIQKQQDDITVAIGTSGTTEQSIIVGPLILDVMEPKENASVPVQGPYVYKFQHWARSGDKVTATPTSSQLLFYPASVEIIVREDTCPGGEVVFQGRQGIFVEGKIHPPLQFVEIAIKVANEAGKEIKVLTDADGQYRVGPLDGDLKYDVSAAKEGYVFTAIEEQFGHFQSFKLAEISVEVKDEADNRLSGVLLSLSGGNGYRRNNATQDGNLMFLGLSPGQYFLKPMMKEYNFEPSSQMIQVEEGVTVNVLIVGKRVAFTCYGSVLSLNGEPEQGIYLEAQGEHPENCKQFQEEAKTEQDGSYRIRGLQPGCEYIVQLSSSEVNLHIERSTPKFRKITVTSEDLTGVNLIAFRRFNQMDISGNVITPQEFVNTLKVFVYKESNMETPYHSLSLGPTSFFYPNSIAIDNQSYILKLTSTLPTSAYDYTLPVIQFVANTSYKHFTIRFDPVRKTTEQDLSHSSFLVLPFTLLLLYIAYNYKQILPVVSQHVSSLLNSVVHRPTHNQQQQQQQQQQQSQNTGSDSLSPGQGQVDFNAGYNALFDAGSKKKLKSRKA